MPSHVGLPAHSGDAVSGNVFFATAAHRPAPQRANFQQLGFGVWAHFSANFVWRFTMLPVLTDREIARLKREAKLLRRADKISHSRALDILARRSGCENWSRLIFAARRDAALSSAAPASRKLIFNTPDGAVKLDERALVSACVDFLSQAGDVTLRAICRNGSIWVSLADLISDSVSLESLAVFGPVRENYIYDAAVDMQFILLLDCEGLAEAFVWPGDLDEDDLPEVPGPDRVYFTLENAREYLLQLVNCDQLQGEIDRLMEWLEIRFMEDLPNA